MNTLVQFQCDSSTRGLLPKHEFIGRLFQSSPVAFWPSYLYFFAFWIRVFNKSSIFFKLAQQSWGYIWRRLIKILHPCLYFRLSRSSSCWLGPWGWFLFFSCRKNGPTWTCWFRHQWWIWHLDLFNIVKYVRLIIRSCLWLVYSDRGRRTDHGYISGFLNEFESLEIESFKLRFWTHFQLKFRFSRAKKTCVGKMTSCANLDYFNCSSGWKGEILN